MYCPQNWFRIALATPELFPANPEANAVVHAQEAREATAQGAQLIIFPELSLSSATAGDLFLQVSFVKRAETALDQLCRATADLDIVLIVGLPLRQNGQTYNTAAVLYKGNIVHREFKAIQSDQREARYFSESFEGRTAIRLRANPEFCIQIDFESELPRLGPSRTADLLVLLSAEAEQVKRGHDVRERLRAFSQSAHNAVAVVSPGTGESGSEFAWSGRRAVAEDGILLAESQVFDTGLCYADLDLEKLQNRRRENACQCEINLDAFNTAPTVSLPLRRPLYKQACFAGLSESEKEESLEILWQICARSLALRATRIGAKAFVLGLSGGLDSTMVLFTAIRAVRILGLPSESLHAISMPGPGSSEHTRRNAAALAEAVTCSFREIPITEAVRLHFRDIGHDEAVHNVVYENAQARERTQILMDLANALGAVQIGTGDLSEAALGWTTFNGDHISMYNSNAGITKTLMREALRYEATRLNRVGQNQAAKLIQKVLDTPVSPELLPPTSGEISQKTEEILGAYELHDFFLWELVVNKRSPMGILDLAIASLGDSYAEAEIKRCLKLCLRRFAGQQFKRSCSSDGPAVCPLALSPRSAVFLPADLPSDLWLAELNSMD